MLSTTSTARVREESFISTLKGEQIWLEAMAKNHHKEVADIIGLLDYFALSNECRAIEHRNLSDARQHFDDWLRKQSVKPIQQSTKQINDIWR